MSIGYTDGDYVLALGVTPVAIRDWYGEQPGGLWPWATDAEAATDEIEVLSSSEINFEQIAALQPDVIIGIGSEIEQADYDKLTAIAPVVAASDEYIEFGTPWDVMQLTIGKALGLEAEAQTLVDDVQEHLDTTVAEPIRTGRARVATSAPSAPTVSCVPLHHRRRPRPACSPTSASRSRPPMTELAGDLFYARRRAEQIALNRRRPARVHHLHARRPRSRRRTASVPGPPRGRRRSQHVRRSDRQRRDVVLDDAQPPVRARRPRAGDRDRAVGRRQSGGGRVGVSLVAWPGADADVDAVVAAYQHRFDSATTFDQKAPFLPDAEALRTTIDGYAGAGGAVGGIQLQPTAVVITGDNAAVTYDVLFAGTPVYTDLDGAAVRQNGEWVITRGRVLRLHGVGPQPMPVNDRALHPTARPAVCQDPTDKRRNPHMTIVRINAITVPDRPAPNWRSASQPAPPKSTRCPGSRVSSCCVRPTARTATSSSPAGPTRSRSTTGSAAVRSPASTPRPRRLMPKPVSVACRAAVVRRRRPQQLTTSAVTTHVRSSSPRYVSRVSSITRC